jgi:hypothetical protein
MLITYERANTYIQGAQRKLRALGFDTTHVDIWVSWVYPYSYCTAHKGKYTVVLGLNALRGEYLRGCRGNYFRALVYHELGHAWLFSRWRKFSTKDKMRWRQVFGPFSRSHRFLDWFFLKKEYDSSKYVSAYATLEPQEDWAETFAIWARSPHRYKTAPKVVSVKLRLVDELVRRYK